MHHLATYRARQLQRHRVGLQVLLGRALVALALVIFFTSFTSRAQAEAIIKYPGMHPAYTVELEPHLFLEPFEHHEGGVGVRATFEIVDNGFVSSINNNVGIGVGLDITGDHVWVPVAMQWNFWLHERWSVFGEPGLVLGNGPRGDIDPLLHLGGRFQFNENLALTLRVGQPNVSLGLSIFM